MSFKEKVLDLVSKIPKGKVTTYKEIAKGLDKPKSYRAVGNALNQNPQPVKIPCHRVIKTNGKIGNYANRRETKKKLLKKEGIEIKNDKINLEKYLFNDF